MHDGIGGTRADGERSGVGILCNLLALYLLSISTRVIVNLWSAFGNWQINVIGKGNKEFICKAQIVIARIACSDNLKVTSARETFRGIEIHSDTLSVDCSLFRDFTSVTTTATTNFLIQLRVQHFYTLSHRFVKSVSIIRNTYQTKHACEVLHLNLRAYLAVRSFSVGFSHRFHQGLGSTTQNQKYKSYNKHPTTLGLKSRTRGKKQLSKTFTSSVPTACSRMTL